MSDLVSGVDTALPETKMSFDTSRIQEVKAWLASQFDAAGKDVPEFEYTPSSISHLHNLATISQAKTQAAGIVANDFRQKAAEYRAQAARIREILENVGLAQESLPSNVVSSAKVLASVSNLLNIRDTELSSYLVAMGDISLRKTGVEEKRAKVQKESKVLLDYIRKAIARLTYLKRYSLVYVLLPLIYLFISRLSGRKVAPTPREIQSAMKDEGIDASYYKAHRARQIAEQIVRASPEDSYFYLHSWLDMLKQKNPGTYTAISTDDYNRFEFCFWSLGCWIRAFPGMRKVVAVDGAHLGAKFCGTLLLATAQDTNNQIYPLAFAIVDVESNLSWNFFFEHLQKSAVPDSVDTYFVSDRHFSIGHGFTNNYILAGHGYCLYHLYNNVQTAKCHSLLRDQWFKVGKAYTAEEFDREMDVLRRMSPTVADKAMQVPLEKWTRAHCPQERFNIMTTNNAECLNAIFKDERKWPIIPLFDHILQTISAWFRDRRESADLWTEYGTKKVTKTLDIRYKEARKLRVQRLSATEALVMDGINAFEVNMSLRTCRCNVYQKDRIPCAHAIAVAKDMGCDHTTLISPLHRNSALKEIYRETIHMVPPRHQWTRPINH